jgi:hypothetical protein
MVGRIERCRGSYRSRRLQFIASLIVSAVLATACVSKGPTSPEEDPGTPDENKPTQTTAPGQLTVIASADCSPRGGPPIQVYIDGERFGVSTERPTGTMMPGESVLQVVPAGVHSLEAFSAMTILIKGPDDVVVSSRQNTNWHVC